MDAPSSATTTTKSPVEPGTRLRTSCDACQNMKMKCSQDKPSCQRCRKNGLACVYSPLRRMGRPKTKRPAESGPTVSSPPAGTARNHQRRNNAAPALGSPFEAPPSAGTPMLIETPGVCEMDSWLRSNGLDHVMTSENAAVSGDGMDGVVNGVLDDVNGSAQQPHQVDSQSGTMLGPAEDMAAGNYCSSGLVDDATCSGLFASNMGFPVSSGLQSSSTSTLQHNWHLRSPPAPCDMMEPNPRFPVAQTQVDGCERGETDSRSGHENCHVRILQRLTHLEQVLERSPPIPSLDVILSAERDTRVLKDALFSCGGHTPQPSNILGLVTSDRERSRGPTLQPCLRAHSSSLIVLVLLADRVTSLLESLFQQAAASSYGIHRALQASSASLLIGSPSEMSNHKGEWRLARSLRGSFPRTINCPVPEASCRLTVGKYEVDNEVESRVMKHILRRRVRALQKMLGEVEEYLEPASGWRRGSRASQDGQGWPDGERPGAVLGDKGGKRGLAMPMARTMVLDLRRRVELLQGRLELAE